MTKKFYYIHAKFDFHDNQQEITNINWILNYIGENGYEVMHFDRRPSKQNPHFDNITFTAKGTKQLMYRDRPVVFKWWGGDLQSLHAYHREIERAKEAEEREKWLQERLHKFGNTAIEDLELPVRAVNVLKAQGYKQLSDIWDLDKQDLMKFDNMGSRTANELMETIRLWQGE